MFNFSEISIDDKSLFDRYIGIYGPQASEFTFTNFYMWRKLYHFRFAEIEGYLCVISVPDYEEPFAMMPVGNPTSGAFSSVIGRLKDFFNEKGWKLVFKKIPEPDTEFFKSLGVPDENISIDRDNSDYIYSASDLIHLKGKKFDGKRNHINRFKREHAFEYVMLGNELTAECKRIMNDWCAAKDCDCLRGGYCERYANMEVLDNLDRLAVKGALIRVDGSYEAFTVGEMLNRDTAVIHIEKANVGVNGLYTLVNQQFCEHEWHNAVHINREQDLGQEGLRKAKLSYNPLRLLYKYTITIE